MAKTFTSNSEALFGNTMTTTDKVVGEVIELENWEIPIEKAAQVDVLSQLICKKHASAPALVEDVGHRYRIDIVASKYIHLFQSSCREHRS